MQQAAVHGSSHYVLPACCAGSPANIGIHHVHHLQSRVPFYRLPEVLRDHPALEQAQRLTLRESLGCLRLHLWDENAPAAVLRRSPPPDACLSAANARRQGWPLASVRRRRAWAM